MASDRVRLRHKPDGTPYVQAYLGRSPVTGRKVRPYREFPGMDDEQAERAAARWLADVARDFAAGRMHPTGDMLSRYVDHMEAAGHSYNTIRLYRFFVRAYAAPIAHVPVGKVDAQRLDRLFHDLLAHGPTGRPLSQRTVRGFQMFLQGAFRHFQGLGLVDHNPVTGTMRVRPMVEEARALDEASVRALTAWIDRELARVPTDDVGVLRRNAALGMLIALHTGMRCGEVCGLRRCDLRLSAGTVSVSGSVVDRDGQAVRQARTKGGRTRNVSVGDSVATAMRRHVAWQDAEGLRLGARSPLLTSSGGFTHPASLAAQFRRARKKLGLDPAFTFHSLRHTHATWLLQGGADMRTVQERLGHARVGTTLEVYGHVMPGRDQAAARAFDALVDDVRDG